MTTYRKQPRWVASLLVSALLMGAAAPALAQDAAPTAEQVKAASEEFEQGRRSFKERDYVEAAEHFEAAFTLAPAAPVLVLAIQAREKAEQLDRAATLAAFALAKYPDQAQVKKAAQPLVTRAKRELHALTARCDTACEWVLGTKLVFGGAGTERLLFVTPGEQTLTAGWSEGRSQRQAFTATAGGASELLFHEPPLPEPKPVVEAPVASTPTAPRADSGASGKLEAGAAPDGGWSPVVFWVGLGATAVLGGVTVWSGLDTRANPGVDAVKEACDSGNAARCNSLYDQGQAAEVRTNVLAGVTAGVGLATILVGVLATDWRGTEESAKGPKQARWTPVLNWGNGATLGAMGRF